MKEKKSVSQTSAPRVLKFRAWDKKNKEICKVYSIYGNSENITSLDTGDVETGFYEGGELETEFILMQYTGLKDKNGKEIYEGDIIKHTYVITKGTPFHDGRKSAMKQTQIETIEFKNYQTPTTLSAFMYGRKNIEFYGWNKEEIEVIGNIYENPGMVDEEDV